MSYSFALMCWKKRVYRIVQSCKLEPVFLVLDADFHVWIAQIKWRGQTRYTEILDNKTLMDTLNNCGRKIGVEIFYPIELFTWSSSCQKLFAGSGAPLSWVAVLFDWNLNRHTVLKQVVDLDLQLCYLENAGLFLFLLWDQWMIERLSRAKRTALVCGMFLQNQSNFIFTLEKILSSHPKIYNHYNLFDSLTESV